MSTVAAARVTCLIIVCRTLLFWTLQRLAVLCGYAITLRNDVNSDMRIRRSTMMPLRQGKILAPTPPRARQATPPNMFSAPANFDLPVSDGRQLRSRPVAR